MESEPPCRALLLAQGRALASDAAPGGVTRAAGDGAEGRADDKAHLRASVQTLHSTVTGNGAGRGEVGGREAVLQAQARKGVLALQQAVAHVGEPVTVVFVASAVVADPASRRRPAFDLHWVKRGSRGTGQASGVQDIVVQTHVGRYSADAGGSFGSNTFHDHEFVVCEAREDPAAALVNADGSSPVLFRHVVDRAKGPQQTVAVDLTALLERQTAAGGRHADEL